MIISIAKAVTLSAGGAVASGQNGTPSIASLGSPQLGNPTRLTIGVETSATTTITINVSFDNGGTWIPATLDGSSALATFTTSGAGAQAMSICPAPYVQIVSSAACKLSAWAYIS
jgi:hypothetical protein